MQHTIVRQPPAQTPVEKIVLEVTPGELLTLTRLLGNDHGARQAPLGSELIHDVVPADSYSVFAALKRATREAGLTA